MNDRFLVVKYVKEFIYSIDNLVVNFPRKEFVIKDRIMIDSLDILEMIYIANMSDDKNLKIKILSKLSIVNVNMKCHKNFKVKMSQFLKYK